MIVGFQHQRKKSIHQKQKQKTRAKTRREALEIKTNIERKI